MHAEVIRKLQQIMGKEGVVADETALLVYECDALTLFKHRPDAVVFAQNARQVSDSRQARQRVFHSVSAPRVGNRTERRRDGGRRRDHHRDAADEQDPVDRCREPHRGRSARRRESPHHAGGSAARVCITRRILRARWPAASAATLRRTPAVRTASSTG